MILPVWNSLHGDMGNKFGLRGNAICALLLDSGYAALGAPVLRTPKKQVLEKVILRGKSWWCGELLLRRMDGPLGTWFSQAVETVPEKKVECWAKRLSGETVSRPEMVNTFSASTDFIWRTPITQLRFVITPKISTGSASGIAKGHGPWLGSGAKPQRSYRFRRRAQ